MKQSRPSCSAAEQNEITSGDDSSSLCCVFSYQRVNFEAQPLRVSISLMVMSLASQLMCLSNKENAIHSCAWVCQLEEAVPEVQACRQGVHVAPSTAGWAEASQSAADLLRDVRLHQGWVCLKTRLQ